MPVTLEITRWAVMWLLAVAIFIGCKGLTWARVAPPRGTAARQVG